VISPVIGFLATVAPKKHASQELDASIEASGPPDFAVRHQPRSSVVPIASIAPHVRDDRDTPLLRARDGVNKPVIWVESEAKYFCKRGWTGKSVICPSRQK
jgi:hypothetical protein